MMTMRTRWTLGEFIFLRYSFDANRLNDPSKISFLKDEYIVLRSSVWWSLMWNGYITPGSVLTLEEV